MTQMTPEQRALAEENLPLVGWYMRRTPYTIRKDEWEDAYQQGALGLCIAAKNYDPAQGAEFSTYAMYYIVGYVRRAINRRIRAEIDCPARLEERTGDEDKTLQDQIMDERMETDMSRRLVIMDALGALDTQERRVMRMTMRGYTQTEIARRRRMTQPSVCRYIRRAREKIRARL